MQLLLTSAAPSNIGQGGDTIIQTQKLCVALRMGQANLLSITNCHPCAGPCSLRPPTRFARVILELGPHAQFSRQLDLCVSSLSREPLVLHREKKKKTTTRICACHPCASHTSVSFKKKKTNSDLDCHSCAGAMKQYPESQRSEEETPSSLRRGHATVSSGR